MADDVASLTSQLDELRAAYRSGAASVQYEGKSVAYRSAADMLAAIRSLEALLGMSTGPKRVVVRTDKGW
jgi:hypothetical protein